MTTTKHVHRWTRAAHLDGCHWFSWQAACKCGATAATTTDRDPSDDYSAAVWMNADHLDPVARCARCAELIAGAPMMHHIVVIAKDGTVEEDNTIETCQEEAA